VPEYAAVLRALDPAKPESILQARDAALAKSSESIAHDAEAVFRQFQAFYNKALSNVPIVARRSPLNALLTDVCERRLHVCDAASADAFLTSTRTEEVNRRKASAGAVADLRHYRAHGVWFQWGEGEWYAAPDPAFVLSFANSMPLGALGAWVTFWAAEQQERVAEDASILIGWEGLRQRLRRWEAFEREYPELPETQVEVRPHVAWLLALYIFGTSNTRAYDTHHATSADYDVRAGDAAASGRRSGRGGEWQMRIDPLLKSSYERFLVENRGSEYFEVIDGIATRITRSDGVPTRELVDFLRAQLTDPYFESWLRGTERWLSGR
jgi:hypothetical protein